MMTSEPTAEREPARPRARRSRAVTVAVLLSLAIVVALLLWRPAAALGFAGGVLTGAGMLGALVAAINHVVVPAKERKSHPAPWVALHIVKFIVAAVFAWLVIVVLGGDVFAFAGGYSVALITLLLSIGRRRDETHSGGPTWD
jgi:F0F1-type ATP synthase assembly protein I